MNEAWGANDSRQQLPVAAVALAADARRKAVAERIESIKAVNTAGDDAVIVFALFVVVLVCMLRWRWWMVWFWVVGHVAVHC